MRYRSFALLFLALALAAIPAGLQAAEYNGGRCDGFMALYGGETIYFFKGNSPKPGYLWFLIQSGGGSAIVQDSAGNMASNLYLASGDLLLFTAQEWIILYYQGSFAQLFYGGANVNIPANPVCNTGSLGPVLVLTDELRNVAVQSSASGPPGIRVINYFKTESLTNTGMAYKRLSDESLWGNFTSTACSGSACCNPQKVTFPVKNNSGGAFTGYILDSSSQAAFDWHAAVPPPLLCSATASPTSGTAPVTVSFEATASGGSGGYHYAWSFGDGKVGTGQKIDHTYKAGGTFTWKLTVVDMADKSVQATGTVKVTSRLIVVAAASPRQGDPPLAVAFTATPKGGKSPYTFQWEFGDGATSTEQNPSHTFEAQGKFTWLVTVTDSSDQSAALSSTVYCGYPIDPTIIAVTKQTGPFRLVIRGFDFDAQALVRVDGVPVPTTSYKSATKLVAKGGSALSAMLPKGVPKCITVLNGSGGLSACFTFTR